MQFAPDAASLLAAIATLLEEDVLPAVKPDLQHRVRVAAHLARLLAREHELGPAAEEREREELGALADAPDGSTAELAAAVAARLRDEDDPVALSRAWDALVSIARGDLAIAKPGHDTWEGE